MVEGRRRGEGRGGEGRRRGRGERGKRDEGGGRRGEGERDEGEGRGGEGRGTKEGRRGERDEDAAYMRGGDDRSTRGESPYMSLAVEGHPSLPSAPLGRVVVSARLRFLFLCSFLDRPIWSVLSLLLLLFFV